MIKIIKEISNELNISPDEVIRACSLLHININLFDNSNDLLDKLKDKQEMLVNTFLHIRLNISDKPKIRNILSNLDELELLDLDMSLRLGEGLRVIDTGYSDVFECYNYNGYLGNINCDCDDLLNIIESPSNSYNLELSGYYEIYLDLGTWLSLVCASGSGDVTYDLEEFINQIFIDNDGLIDIDRFNEEDIMIDGYYYNKFLDYLENMEVII